MNVKISQIYCKYHEHFKKHIDTTIIPVFYSRIIQTDK